MLWITGAIGVIGTLKNMYDGIIMNYEGAELYFLIFATVLVGSIFCHCLIMDTCYRRRWEVERYQLILTEDEETYPTYAYVSRSENKCYIWIEDDTDEAEEYEIDFEESELLIISDSDEEPCVIQKSLVTQGNKIARILNPGFERILEESYEIYVPNEAYVKYS